MRLRRTVFLTLATSAALAASAAAAAAVPLIQHRAVYDLTLEKASDRSGITGISGRMVYEFRGSACEGYTVRFRYVTKSQTAESAQVNDQQTTTFEDAEGKTFSFATKSYTDQNLDKEIRGNAEHAGAGVKVEIEQPAAKTLDVTPAQFPTQHLVDLIDRANKGETFYETTIFDGSDDGDEAMTTTVVVGKKTSVAADDPEAKALEAVKGEQFWPVDIAYFKMETAGGEATPDYQISFKLYENGLTRDLTMDYGDFTIKGTLVDLATFAPDNAACAR